MHIVFLTSEYPPPVRGGIGTFTQTLARALVKQGCQATVIGCYRVPETVIEDDEGVKVMRLTWPNPPWLGLVWNRIGLEPILRDLYRRQPFDVLDGPENAFAFYSKRVPYARVIRMQGGHHYYSVMLGRKQRFFPTLVERLSFRRADAVATTSRFLGETNRKLLKLGDLPLEILPNPVNTHHFRPDPSITEEPGSIIFIGSLVEKKGIRHLIDAMPRIVAAVPHATLRVVGADRQEPETGRSMIEVLKARLPTEIQDHVHFMGGIPNQELPALMGKAQVAVYPSHMEAFGIVFVEGMAMQKAVVVGRTGAGSEVVLDGETGLLCDPLDSNSIADSVIRLLQDSELRARLGKAARQRAVEHYSIDRLVTKNLDFYRQVIDQHARLHQSARVKA